MGVRLFMPLGSFVIFILVSFGCGTICGIYGYYRFMEYYKRKD
ncbi:hypothetical protein [Clostridium sp. DL1XJH146]